MTIQNDALKKQLEKRVEQIKNLKTKIDTKYFHKTMKDMNLPNPYEIVRDYIMAKGLKLYGGQAIHEHLDKQGSGIYEKYQLPDYDVYSPDAWNHAKELSDLFYKMGYEYVVAKASVMNDDKHQTYKVGVNFFFMLDITQAGCPRTQHLNKKCGSCGNNRYGKCIDVFNKIPCNDLNYYKTNSSEIIEYKDTYSYKRDKSLYPESLFVCSPEWLKVSMHYELSVPLADPSRTVKVATRLEKFNEFFEFNHDLCNNNKQSNKINEKFKPVLKEVGLFLKHKKHILYGVSAYNFFTKGSVFKKHTSLVDYEAYSRDIKNDLNELKEKLKKKFKKISIKIINKVEYWKGADSINSLLIVGFPNIKPRIVAKLTKYTNCMPYIQSKGIRYATIERIKYILYQSIIFKDILDAGESKNYACILSHILKAEEEYKNKSKSPGKFKRFITKCQGDEINQIIENLRKFSDEKEELLRQTTMVLDYPKPGLVSKIYPKSGDINMDIPYKPGEDKLKKYKIPVRKYSKRRRGLKTQFITKKRKRIKTPLFNKSSTDVMN